MFLTLFCWNVFGLLNFWQLWFAEIFLDCWNLDNFVSTNRPLSQIDTSFIWSCVVVDDVNWFIFVFERINQLPFESSFQSNLFWWKVPKDVFFTPTADNWFKLFLDLIWSNVIGTNFGTSGMICQQFTLSYVDLKLRIKKNKENSETWL